jgi:hypothetical protein
LKQGLLQPDPVFKGIKTGGQMAQRGIKRGKNISSKITKICWETIIKPIGDVKMNIDYNILFSQHNCHIT